MKTDPSQSQFQPQPTSSQPPSTQTTFLAAAQWGQPSVQQQPASATYPYHSYPHYPQAQYSGYPQYAAQQQPATAAPTMARQTIEPLHIQTQQSQSSAIDTADIATLNDALGSAGVDLRAEEETLHRSTDQYQQYRHYEDRSRKQPTTPSFDNRTLGPIIRFHGVQHKVTTIREDSITYIALALRFRLQELLEAMIAVSEHRTDTQWEREPGQYGDGTSMWGVVVRNDVAKQLAAIEKVEREEEMKVRRERKDRAEAAAQAIAQSSSSSMSVDGARSGGSGGGGEDGEGGGPKKKKKKDGPGVTARNMSEDVRKKMSNAVASQAAGLSTQKYAWMNAAANSANIAAKAKAASASAAAASGGGGVGGTSGLTPATTTAPAASATSGSGWARPYLPTTTKSGQQETMQKEEYSNRTVTLRDAMFVVEKEKGHGGGKGSAKGWT